MFNKSTITEIIYKKWFRGSISMSHNEMVLVLYMDVQMDINGGSRMDADEEGAKK